MYNRIW